MGEMLAIRTDVDAPIRLRRWAKKDPIQACRASTRVTKKALLFASSAALGSVFSAVPASSDMSLCFTNVQI